MYKTWDDLTVVGQLQTTYSDLYKDVHGCRPRITFSDDCWKNEDWLRNKVADLEEQLSRQMAEEAIAEAASVAEFEKKLADVMTVGNIDRQNAIRWMLEANDASDDPNYACYQLGLPYGYLNPQNNA